MTSLSSIDRLVPQHLEEDVLVAFLDGELLDGERVEAANHLERCWECRSRLSAIEASIEIFLRARRALLPDELPPSAPAIAQFRARLAAHDDHPLPRWPLHRRIVALRRRLRQTFAPVVPWRARPAFAVATLAVVATVLLVGWWTTPLSANDVLARADVRELLDVRTANAVVTSLVQIEKINPRTQRAQPIGTLETAKDYASFALSAVARPARGGVLQEVVRYEEDLAARHYFRVEFGEAVSAYVASQQWVPTVSVGNYVRLIGGRGRDDASARRLGHDLIELHHPFAPGHQSGIRETRLLLDASTYAPAQLSIFVAEKGETHEYRFRRLNLRFVTRSPEWAERFASVRPGSRPDRVSRTRPRLFEPPLPRRPLPLSYADSVATTEEVEAAMGLHAAGADLGEEVNLFPMSDGSLLVQGLVETAARKTAIEQAVARVSGRLRVELYTPSELTTGTELFDSPYGSFAPPLPTAVPSTPSVRLIDFAGVKIPLYDQLHEHFTRVRARAGGANEDAIQRDMTTFVTDVLERSEAALFHAWALRKLDVQFPPRRVAQLGAGSMERMNQIRDNHRRAVADASRELSRRLEAVNPDATTPSNVSAREPKDLDAVVLLRLASEQRDLLRSLFVPSVTAPDIGTAVARLVTVLRRLA
jgi:anti-sigma factor RsiW